MADTLLGHRKDAARVQEPWVLRAVLIVVLASLVAVFASGVRIDAIDGLSGVTHVSDLSP